jgi:hypothetical protein
VALSSLFNLCLLRQYEKNSTTRIMKIDEVTTIMMTSFPEELDPLVGGSVGDSDGASVSAIAVYIFFKVEDII